MTAQENWLMHLPLTVVVSGGPGAADFFRNLWELFAFIFKAISINYHFESSSNKKKPPTGADKMAQWVEATMRTQKFAP